MLDWVGDVATSQGAEVTGPRLPMSRRQKTRFLLLGLHFLAALFATRVPLNPSTPPPPRQEPLNLNHVSISVSQSCLGLQLSPLLSDSSLGLLAWARLSPILASSEASRLLGQVRLCPWLVPHAIDSPASSGLTCLPALLGFPSGGTPSFLLENISVSREEPSLPFAFNHLQPFLVPVPPPLPPCVYQPQALVTVRIHCQCYVSTAGYGARGFDATLVAFLLVDFASSSKFPPSLPPFLFSSFPLLLLPSLFLSFLLPFLPSILVLCQALALAFLKPHKLN